MAKQKDPSEANFTYILREELKKKYHFFTLDDSNELYIYNEPVGIYTGNADPVVKKLLNQRLGNKVNMGTVIETVNLLKIDTYISRGELNPIPDLIPVGNGLLDINTRELKPYNPQFLYTYKLPVDYNPDAKCCEFMQFLDEIIANKYHKAIQQLLGFFLRRRYFPKKGFIVVGPRDSGKTTFANVIISFLGQENISTKSIQAICERFGTVDLFGKIANICDENPAGALKDFDKFKSLTGDSYVEGEIKGVQKKVRFWNTAKMLFLCNEIPPADKADEAYYARWVILPFPHRFTSDNPNRDAHKINKLITKEELSGILNFALDGYCSLKDNEQFDYSDSSGVIKKMYFAYSGDEISRFIVERLIITSNSDTFTPRYIIYDAFKRYCIEQLLVARDEDSFWRAFYGRVPDCESRLFHPTVDGKQTRAYRGIELC